MGGRSASEIVLFLMVMGNISIVYQKEIADASKKCKGMKKIVEQGLVIKSASLWVEMKNRGLKIIENLDSSTY